MAKQYSAPPSMGIDPKKKYRATIVTGKGNIVVELYLLAIAPRDPQAARTPGETIVRIEITEQA